MFIFHHRAKIENLGGFNFAAFINPVRNKKDFIIHKIEADVTDGGEIGLFKGDATIVKGALDITKEIQDTVIGKIVQTNAIALQLPIYTNEFEPIKFTHLPISGHSVVVTPDEGWVLQPGNAILIRFFVYKGSVVGNCTIYFEEDNLKEKEIIEIEEPEEQEIEENSIEESMETINDNENLDNQDNQGDNEN